MDLVWSKELASVAEESRDVAERLGQEFTSAHLLLCLFTLKNRASMFLSDRQVTADRLLDQLADTPTEAPDTWDRIMRRAHDVALVSGGDQVTSLHVLVALCSFVESAAYQLISTLELDMGTVRNTALSYLTSTVAEPYQDHDLVVGATVTAPARAVGTAPIRFSATRTVTREEEEGPDEAPARGLREPDDVRRRRRRTEGKPQRPAEPSGERETTRSLAARVFGKTPPPRKAARTDLPLPPSVRRTGEHKPVTGRPEAVARHQLLLRESRYPLLAKMGRNLSLLAYDGNLDRVVGRDSEIDQLVDILNKRRANNPVLVGDAGVGKTSVAEGLAQRMVGSGGVEPPPGLGGRIVVELEASKVISGTGLRGSFSERLQQLKKEVLASRGQIIVFLDELHQWIGMGGSGDGSSDGAGELKTALARGEFPCIGATTFDEFHRFIEGDPAFARRFQQVRVVEPEPDEAIRILTGVRDTYAEHHGIEFGLDAIEAAVRLTHRYLPDRRLPDKAISVLDLAGSRARRIGAAAVGRPLVAEIVARLAGLSPDKLLMADRELFLNLEEQLMRDLVGHRAVIERVAHTLRRNYAGFVSGRPIGSFLFLGSTGVGKTEFAKVLARVLFEREGAMLRLDMSEFMEAHSVARLIGSPPGYVGHDIGGQLTEAVRRKPYQLVLLDEIEKAHPDVLNLLIQLLDEGRLTDSRGRTVDFSHTVVIMTSNLGAETALGGDTRRRVGFGQSEVTPDGDDIDSRVRDAARSHFRIELWNRMDEQLVFRPLGKDEVARIARLQLTRSSERLFEERKIAFSFAPEVVDLLIESGGFDPELGARPMRRTIERLVESRIADLILSGQVTPPAELEVVVCDGDVRVQELRATE